MDWLFSDHPDISFEEFVKQALFHPENGYYTHSIPTVGEGGDFSTSATMSELLARGISHWITHRPKLLPVIEVGAGDGSLARDIIAATPLLQRFRLDYNIVEKSPPLQREQQSKLPRSTTWHTSLSDALRALGGEALIFSNELVDAFPPRVFRAEDHGFSELYVDRSFTEIWRPCSHLPESSAFRSWPRHQRIEVHESYRNWQLEQLTELHSGEVLTVDYGDIIDTLYHRAPQGTLRAYLHHNRLEGPELFLNPGKQDITCDVNFTDLISWGESMGLSTISHQTQAEFLTPHSRGTSVDHYLLHPDGPGTAFKVLLQKKTY